MAKIYPNDPCLCGSGKKYKHCCGAKKRLVDQELKKSDLRLEDFVLEKLSEDITFLANALQIILGPYGYNYCEENKEILQKEFKKDQFKSFVKEDKLGLYATTENSDKKKILNIRPYGGQLPEEQTDIVMLLEKDHISVEGRQVDLFHAYLLDNLARRFQDYLYVPSEQVVEKQEFGAFARRGYDFLLALTLYLELQLGVHVYLEVLNPGKIPEEYASKYRIYYGIDNMPGKDKIPTGMMLFLMHYAHVIIQISQQYKPEEEVALYHKIGAYTEEEYPDRKAMIQPGYFAPYPVRFDYEGYLRFLVSATCFNQTELYAEALSSFPQCDFVKYLYGIENVVELFEDKTEKIEINPAEHFDLNAMRAFEDATGLKLNTEKHVLDMKAIYHGTVFYLMDELNGMSNHMKPTSLVYKDFADINDDDFTVKDGKRDINPARKSTRINPIRKLKMEIYDALNGKCFNLCMGEEAGDMDHWKIVGKFPMLPWISNGKEPVMHSRPFDHQPRPEEDIYSCEVQKRQDFLTMEYRLTSIPINCIEEFLNPDVFYQWKSRQELLKETERQNEELKSVNESLKRHIHLNQELVRNLSHSSANYLNSDKLAQTGIELHGAEEGSPSVEKLHLEGLSLILQSEQEMFLSRQLNSLVWRCSADHNELMRRIREGLSKEEGRSILQPIEFALKTVMARVLFRDEDYRSEFIRNKLKKSEEELLKMKSSFMLDILARKDNEEGFVIEWWKNYVGPLTIKTSSMWELLKIKKDKSFSDLITEIVTEQVLNALSHGELSQEISIELGEADMFKGRPRWTYICCENICGESYQGGRGVGIDTLNEALKLINGSEKGLETRQREDVFESTAWLYAKLLRAL